MKSIRLVSTLRTLFGVSRILLLLAVLISPIYFFPISNNLETTMAIGPNEFRLAHDYRSTGVDVQLRYLKATVTIDDKDRIFPDLVSLRRKTTGPAELLRIAFSFLISDLLWRLFRNLEAGVVFDAANIRYVRRLGLIMIFGSGIITAFQSWANAQIGNFIAGHVWLDGIHHTQIGAPPEAIHVGLLAEPNEFNTSFIVTGLAILVLAEVFRQGFELKQDTELTV